jgi:hypothetical protein
MSSQGVENFQWMRMIASLQGEANSWQKKILVLPIAVKK